MAELKTKQNDQDVETFLNTIPHQKRREDAFSILKLMKETTNYEPVMWGAGIIGFGSYHYKYESGREGDWFLTGFSARKQSLVLYIMAGFSRYDDLMKKLGKFKTGKSCLYIKNLEDIDLNVLKELITISVQHVLKTYPQNK